MLSLRSGRTRACSHRAGTHVGVAPAPLAGPPSAQRRRRAATPGRASPRRRWPACRSGTVARRGVGDPAVHVSSTFRSRVSFQDGDGAGCRRRPAPRAPSGMRLVAAGDRHDARDAELAADDHGVAQHAPRRRPRRQHAGTNSGVHDGSVIGATSTSPGSSAVGSDGSSTTRARPRPCRAAGQPGQHVARRQALTVGRRAAGQVDSGGGSPTNTNGGSSRPSSLVVRAGAARIDGQ